MKEALHQTQEQKLQQKLSPLQVQFVKMLEKTGPEMEEDVRHEIEDNPALVTVDPIDTDTQKTEDGENFKESADDMQKADYKNEEDIPSYRTRVSNHSADEEYLEPILVSEETLFDYLTSQISERPLTDKQRMMADYIIGNIDDNGYLTRSISAISDDLIFQVGLEVSDEEIDEVLQMIRDLDPAGVCAENLRDCLLLQLERMEGNSKYNMAAYEIIDRYFDEFSKKHFDKIVSAMGLTEEEFQKILRVVKTLNPKPGSLYAGGESSIAQHITPDFNVEVDDDDIITLTLVNNIPELQIEDSFKAEFDKMSAQKTLKKSEENTFSYIRDKYESASNFIKMLRQRQETLFNTMHAIVEWQKEFFLTNDDSSLRPMVLKDIAAITNYDISVISRATAGKYVQTQSGVYPIKFFFNEGLKNESGEDVSSREIQVKLKEIIDGENKKKPYSDERLCDMLKEQGYEIARRTIAKYREKMSIPVARLRKEL